MQALDNLKIGSRLVCGFGAAALIVVLETGFAFSPAGGSRTSVLTASLVGVLLIIALGVLVGRSLTAPLAALKRTAKGLSMGHLSQRSGLDRKDEFGDLSRALDGLAEDLQTRVVGTLRHLAAGELGAPLRAQDAQDELTPALAEAAAALQSLCAEARHLVGEATEGRLATRADLSRGQGEYRQLLQGLNEIMEALASPLGAAQTLLARLAVNDCTNRMTGTYRGDFQAFADSINGVRDRMLGAQSLFVWMAEGDLKQVGGFRQIGRRSEQDRLLPASLAMADSLEGLERQILLMVKAAVNGDLTLRGDEAAFHGIYQEIIKGLNQLMAATEAPVKEVMATLERLTLNDSKVRVTKDYSGVWNDLKQDLNRVATQTQVIAELTEAVAKGDISRLESLRAIGRRCEDDRLMPAFIMMMEALKRLIDETTLLSQAAADGNLATRADATHHHGEFRKIVEGINGTLDRVMGPINEVRQVMAAVENGDLSVRIVPEYQGDFQALRSAVNNTIAKLGTTISDVLEASQNMVAASEQVSATAQSLSQSASEQAASVEQTSAAMEEMSASITQNNDNAKITGEIAKKTSRETAEGGQAVHDTVTAMQEIARKIAIVDDIAYQTNLLALNAAIEAGRAGEHGKGFAVVAAEVRKLAERSQVAAEEISQLASHSVGLAERAGTLLGAIVPSIQKTADLVEEITAASGEQSSGIGQIGSAINTISQAVQQNAAASEELASTSEEVNAQAMELQTMMTFFTLATSPQQRGGAQRRPVPKILPKPARIQGAKPVPADFTSF